MIKRLGCLFLSLFLCLSTSATDYTQDANIGAAWLMDVDEDPITDSSPNNHHAALKAAGEPNFNAVGQFGGSYDFDGSDDFCDVNADPVPALDEQLTIVSWLNLDNLTGTDSIYGGRDTGFSGGYKFDFRGTIAGDPLRLTIFGVTDIDSDASGISATTWTHVAVTYNKVNVRFFVDGVAKGAPAQSGNIAASDVDPYIGAFNNRDTGGTSFLGGLMDEVALFSRPLDSTEINDIMDNGLVGAVPAVRRTWYYQ